MAAEHAGTALNVNELMFPARAGLLERVSLLRGRRSVTNHEDGTRRQEHDEHGSNDGADAHANSLPDAAVAASAPRTTTAPGRVRRRPANRSDIARRMGGVVDRTLTRPHRPASGLTNQREAHP